MSDPFKSLRVAIDVDPRDWSANPSDAWIYGIVIGWGERLRDVALRSGWDAEACERLRLARERFAQHSDAESCLAWERAAEEREIEEGAIRARIDETADQVRRRAGRLGVLLRCPDGHIDNCALVAGYEEAGCQMCSGNCPDRARFAR